MMKGYKLNKIRFIRWKVWTIEAKITQNSLHVRSIGRKSRIWSLAINQRCHLCRFITKFLAKCLTNLWLKRVDSGLTKRNLDQMKDRRSLICQALNKWSSIGPTKCRMDKKNAIEFHQKMSSNRDVFSLRLSKDKSRRFQREMVERILREAIYTTKDSTRCYKQICLQI